MTGLLGDDDDLMTASAKGHSRQPLPRLLSGSGLLGGSTMADIPRSEPTPWRNHVEPAQVLPDNFQVEYIEKPLTFDEALAELQAVTGGTYYPTIPPGPDSTSVVLWGDETKVGNGATVTNGKVLTITPQGGVLRTVTGDHAVSIDGKGRARRIRLERT